MSILQQTAMLAVVLDGLVFVAMLLALGLSVLLDSDALWEVTGRLGGTVFILGALALLLFVVGPLLLLLVGAVVK